MAASGCSPLDTNPTPSKPPATAVIEVAVVQICLDISTAKRYNNNVCGGQTEGYTWVYLVDDITWPAYIPPAGQVVQNGRWRIERPQGVDIELAPDEGAYFAR